MYSKRATFVTFNSLRHLHKVCGRNPTDFSFSVRIPDFFRNFGVATESSDIYNNFDRSADENQAGYSSYNQNDQFYGRNLGGFQQRQNPSRVYEERIGNDRFNHNHSDFNYGDRNIDGGELNQSPPRIHGQKYVWQSSGGKVRQNESFNGFGSRGTFMAPPPINGGVRLENSRGDFSCGSNFSGSYIQNEDMQVQNVHSAGVHPQNVAGNYHSNAGSIDVAQESQLMGKLEDLDKYTKEGKVKEAVELLGLLQKKGVQVELPQYIALMKSCGENEALNEAKSVHEHLLKSLVHLETCTYNQILEMYSRCGSMNDAFAVFDRMPKRNLTSWDIMISWLAKNDLGEDSLELFAEFKGSGLKPDGEMFIGVFTACGVLCDTVEGILHFESMMKDYGIVPTMKHYVSIVDMLGNSGSLDEALEFIEKMPIEPSIEIWETLMKFCRVHGNMELGDRCAELVELLDSSRLNEQSRAGLIPISAADLVREKEKKKSSGQNPLDVRSRVHEYRAGDRSPDNDRIYELLRGLKQQMKEVGYVPETKFVLHDVDQEVKEEALMAHSERLAAAQGFLTSAARSPLRIIKNLRFCGDCHNAFKIISKIVGREIVARDSKRFHHFRDGSCSCNDFW